MSDSTITYNVQRIPPFAASQVAQVLTLLKRYKSFRTNESRHRIHQAIATLFGLQPASYLVGEIIGQLTRIQRNFSSFSTMNSSYNEQVEDILDMYRESINEDMSDDERELDAFRSNFHEWQSEYRNPR